MRNVLTSLAASVLLLCGNISAEAQSNKLSNGSEGTEFWFSFPVSWQQLGSTDVLKIYVACETAVPCTLEIPGLGKQVVQTTKPGDVIEFTLTPNEGQPYVKSDAVSVLTEEQSHQNGIGRGIHVYADAPITVYSASRIQYTSDTFIALPVSALGTEYIVASYADVTGNFPGQHLPSQAVIVAAFDSTSVSFTLGGSTGTQTIGGMSRGQVKNFMLNKGDVIAFANKKVNGAYADLSGSKIISDKPVAVTSGNQCAYIDVNTPTCDFIMEMELPTHSWGKEYHVTNFNKRLKHSFIKVFAKNPNTNLYRDGENEPFATLTTAGGIQGLGYYEGRVLEDGSMPRPVIIRADGPISVTQFNPGQMDDNVSSDPFQLVLTPIEQYQREITFNTPGIKGGLGFKNNYINFVFEGKNPNDPIPDDVEFGIVEDGTVTWSSLKNVFGSDAVLFNNFPEDTKKFFQKILTLPGDGVYKIRAEKPFAAYSYGFSDYDSYAHPTSLLTNDVSSEDDKHPMIITNSDNGYSVNLTIEDKGTESSKITRVFLHPATSTNYRLITDKFIPGVNESVTARVEVIDLTKDAEGELIAVDRAGNINTVELSYAANPSSVAGEPDMSFSISPNPATGYVTITFPPLTGETSLVKVFDALGNEVADFTGKITSESISFSFDTHSLPNGAYFIRFSDGKNTYSQTFVVNN
jgi:hypothetical protein